MTRRGFFSFIGKMVALFCVAPAVAGKALAATENVQRSHAANQAYGLARKEGKTIIFRRYPHLGAIPKGAIVQYAWPDNRIIFVDSHGNVQELRNGHNIVQL